MKKQLIALISAAFIANIAHAETSGFYLGGQVGASLTKTETVIKREGDFKYSFLYDKTGFSSGITAGYNFHTNFNVPIRTDFSFTGRDSKYSGESGKGQFHTKAKIKVNNLMFNAYYDIYTNSNFTPYFTLGAGTAFIHADTDTDGEKETQHKTNFAYSVGLGVTYKITDQWSADIMSRSIFAGKLKDKTGEHEGTKVAAHDLMIGILYNF